MLKILYLFFSRVDKNNLILSILSLSKSKLIMQAKSNIFQFELVVAKRHILYGINLFKFLFLKILSFFDFNVVTLTALLLVNI